MVFLFDCLPDRLLRKMAYISVSVFTSMASSSGVSWRQTLFFFYFLACVWMKTFFLRSPNPVHALSFLSAFFSLVPLTLCPLLCCPLLLLYLSRLFSSPFVLPAAEFKEGTCGAHGCALEDVLPVASWSESNLRGTEGVLDIGQDFKAFICSF